MYIRASGLKERIKVDGFFYREHNFLYVLGRAYNYRDVDPAYSYIKE